MKDKYKKVKIITSIVLSFIAAILLTALCTEAVAVFEASMLPDLWLPIIIVWIPAFMFIYGAVFKKKKLFSRQY